MEVEQRQRKRPILEERVNEGVGVKNKLNSDKCIDREGQRSHSARRRPDGGPGPCSKWSAAVGQAEGK